MGGYLERNCGRDCGSHRQGGIGEEGSVELHWERLSGLPIGLAKDLILNLSLYYVRNKFKAACAPVKKDEFLQTFLITRPTLIKRVSNLPETLLKP